MERIRVPARMTVKAMERQLARKRIKEQERRIEEFIQESGTKSEYKLFDAWLERLEKSLLFPFTAKIVDDPGPLDIGDVLKVIKLDNTGQMCGLLAVSKYGRRKYVYPLCLLEVVDKDGINFQLVDDYNFWFGNR